ncbi:MAG: hypothetical protein ACREJ3_10755 [Polyangiaceae bacterium]
MIRNVRIHARASRSAGRRLLAVLAGITLALLSSGGALAQDHHAKTPSPRKHAEPHHRKQADAPAHPDVHAGREATPASPATKSGAAVGAGVSESKTPGGGAHVFKFSELDIEGRLKSPKLVYFLRRVRAEFSPQDLGHRSFMREMSETRKESSF